QVIARRVAYAVGQLDLEVARRALGSRRLKLEIFDHYAEDRRLVQRVAVGQHRPRLRAREVDELDGIKRRAVLFRPGRDGSALSGGELFRQPRPQSLLPGLGSGVEIAVGIAGAKIDERLAAELAEALVDLAWELLVRRAPLLVAAAEHRVPEA